MESAKFTRTIEDFACEHCGREVKGNGYTNHCPACLWSKHVDVNPGDRAAACGGMMEPVWAGKDGGKDMILHRCARCGFERRKELVSGDDFDAFIGISASPR
jgi:DNA-directed RNA polymerase subunit RPC12/RpoP